MLVVSNSAGTPQYDAGGIQVRMTKSKITSRYSTSRSLKCLILSSQTPTSGRINKPLSPGSGLEAQHPQTGILVHSRRSELFWLSPQPCERRRTSRHWRSNLYGRRVGEPDEVRR